MIKILLTVSLVLFLSLPVLAGEAGRFGLGINYGVVNNLRAWNAASTESGSMLRIDYTYDFTNYYTAALEIAFYADEYVFKTSSVATYPQTVTMSNIDHIFHTRKIGLFSPYLKIGTGIYAMNLWRKVNDSFYQQAIDVMADVSAGAGAEFKLWNAIVNVDLLLPALIHEMFHKTKMAYSLSFGLKHYF